MATTPPTVPGFSVPAPNRTEPATFSVRMDTFLGELQPNVDGENDLATWMNDTATQVEIDAATVAAAAGLTDFQGDYVPGTTYTLGQSVTDGIGGDFWISKANGNQGNALVPGLFWAKIDLTSIAVQTSGFDLDWAQEDILKFTAIADFTITFSNIPTGGMAIVEIKGGGDWTPTYPAEVVGDIPDLATGTDSTVLGFYTSNGGTTIAVSSYQAVTPL